MLARLPEVTISLAFSSLFAFLLSRLLFDSFLELLGEGAFYRGRFPRTSPEFLDLRFADSVADTSSTDAEFSSVRAEGGENFSDRESHCKMRARKRTTEFQPRPFCLRVFLPATRARTARRNFSRSAGLSMSSLRFIASATV